MKSYEAVQSPSSALKPEPTLPVSAQQVRQQLAKISAAEEFQRSERSRRFLNYIVEETLDGRASRIKAYSVAISVLDRDDTFDPQTDPMVRIEASQLRRRLERYYLTKGVNDPVIIDLPKGGYVPVFRSAIGLDLLTNTDTPPSRGVIARRISAAVVATAFLVTSAITIAVFWLPAGTHRAPIFAGGHPTIQVLPFSAVTSDNLSSAIVAGLADEVTQVLTRHGTLGVLAPPDKVGGVTRNRADMLLTGSVRSNAGMIRMTASLMDARMGTYVWTEVYDMPANAPVLTLQTGLALELGSRLPTSSGVMDRPIAQSVSRDGVLPASLPANR